MKILDREQLSALLDGAASARPNSFLPAFLPRLALDSGARPQEYLACRWNDVDYTKRGLRIDEALKVTKKDGITIEEETKTELSRRTVTLSERTMADLAAEQKKQETIRKDLGRNETGLDDLIFPHSPAEPNRPVNPEYVSKAFARLARKLKFTGLRLYDMRHNCASHMLAAGRPVTDVAAHLGHADASTTLRFYGFAIPKREAGAGLLDDLIP